MNNEEGKIDFNKTKFKLGDVVYVKGNNQPRTIERITIGVGTRTFYNFADGYSGQVEEALITKDERIREMQEEVVNFIKKGE